MFGETLGMIPILIGMAFLIPLGFRFQNMPSLTRQALIGTCLGLIMVGRYVAFDHSISSIAFAVGISIFLILVVLRHFQAFSTKV